MGNIVKHHVSFANRGKILLVVFISAIFNINSIAQTIDEIKLDQRYYWGEGTAEKRKDAKDIALSNLVSSICVHVSQYSSLDLHNRIEGDNVHSTEEFTSRMRTYSTMTLNNCHTKELTTKAPFTVFLYIEKADVEKMFKSRENRVREFVNIANKAYLDMNLADALRYYYSAYLYAHSLMDPSSLNVEDEDEDEQSAMTWIKRRIEEILSNTKPVIMGKNGSEANVYRVGFFYKDRPVSRIGYTYWDGSSWTERPEFAIDGQGLVELMPSFSPQDSKIQIEYKFENQVRNDPELMSIYEALADDVNFRASGGRVSVSENANTTTYNAVPSASKIEKSSVSAVSRTRPQDKPLSNTESKIYRDVLTKVIQCISQKTYGSVESLCTPEGYKAFKELIHYGSAKIVGTPNVTFLEYNGHIYGRSVPMQFSFRGNNKFTENVVFTFTPEGKVDDVTFGLGKLAEDNLYDNLMDEKLAPIRSAINNFLESYKTAYALGRMDYLEQVFSDDALIITGKVVMKRIGDAETGYSMRKVVVNTRQSKSQYLENLRRAFASKEFINLQFANNSIRPNSKAISQGHDVYGIQIRQDYYSNNYSDQGYLFLLVDVSNPDHPIIHVRVWQEKPDDLQNIAGIEDF